MELLFLYTSCIFLSDLLLFFFSFLKSIIVIAKNNKQQLQISQWIFSVAQNILLILRFIHEIKYYYFFPCDAPLFILPYKKHT